MPPAASFARRAAALVTAAVAVLLALPAHAGVTAAGPLRMMVVGDSISQGFAGDWTWRYWVARELARQHVPVDLVGPSRLPSYGTRYERPWSWDTDHAAKGGSRVEDHLQKLPSLLVQYSPDVLVVELGINDVVQGDSAQTLATELEQLVQGAQVVRPGIKVVVAEIPGMDDPAVDATTAQANDLVAQWAPLHGVQIAHNRSGEGRGSLVWSPRRDTFDGLHPNASGQTLLALRVAQALHRVGVLPEVPRGIYQVRTWQPDARPEAVALHGALHVTWRTANAQLRLQWVRVLVDGQARTAWLRTGLAPTGVLVAVPPGRHRVQLVPRRGTMIGAAGTAVYATVD